MPNDSYFAVRTAIECLKDIGWTKPQIEQRIGDWMAKGKLAGDWQDLSEKHQMALAAVMMKGFVVEFEKIREVAA